jgi:hypothetical protein
MNTIVSFVGLFVLIYTQDVGYQVLFPHFNIQPHHDSVIAYPKDHRVEGTGPHEWQEAGTFDVGNVTWAYVKVVKEYITFAGATNGVPAQLQPSLNSPVPPHLSCCCTALKPGSAGGEGIKDSFKNPDLPAASKQGAQVLVTRGVTSTSVSPPEDLAGRIDTQFSMTTPVTTPPATIGIVIEGTLGANIKRIAFKPGANVKFGNTPLCVLQGNCPDNLHDHEQGSDFAAYYTMAKQSNTCKGAPSTCQQCGMSAESAGPCNSSSCTSATLKKAMTKGTVRKFPKKQVDLMETIDCSNSQWP